LKRFSIGEKLYARDKSIRGGGYCRRPRTLKNARGRLLLPGALLVTIQAQLLAPFMLVDFCLAAFFD
jgi:hypothetical protein